MTGQRKDMKSARKIHVMAAEMSRANTVQVRAAIKRRNEISLSMCH